MLCTNILINNTTHGHTYGIVALFFCCNARVFNQGISDWEWEEDEEMIWCYQGQAPSPRNGSSSFAWATCASGYSSPTGTLILPLLVALDFVFSTRLCGLFLQNLITHGHKYTDINLS
jgi:hypothetical protein